MSESTAPTATGLAATEERFPRSKLLPTQSPLYWVAEKDRYLRQLLIRDIEAVTGRSLIVYFAAMDATAQISLGDDVFFTEMLRDVKGGSADLRIQTAGGFTDATEKIVSLLRAQAPHLRVTLPRRANSNGTIIALVGKEVLMGPCSELGPADPFIQIALKTTMYRRTMFSPGRFDKADPIYVQAARYAIMQTAKLAASLLETGMLSGQPDKIEAVVNALSSREQYHSHGSVIDAGEAERLGLKVTKFKSDAPLWQQIWLLRCMYEHDIAKSGVLKIFEGASISNRTRAGVIATISRHDRAFSPRLRLRFYACEALQARVSIFGGLLLE